MDIKRLAISNSQKRVRAFKKILSNPLIDLEASTNVVPNFPRPNAFNNTVSNLFGPKSSSSTPKGFFHTNAKLGNSQKKKATQQILLDALKIKLQY